MIGELQYLVSASLNGVTPSIRFIFITRVSSCFGYSICPHCCNWVSRHFCCAQRIWQSHRRQSWSRGTPSRGDDGPRALHDICHRILDTELSTYTKLNRWLVQIISLLTALFFFDGTLNVSSSRGGEFSLTPLVVAFVMFFELQNSVPWGPDLTSRWKPCSPY